MAHPEILLFFCCVAFIYASVGFGGGSSYLAILAFYSFPFHELRLTALVCNLVVVSGGTIIFIRHKEVSWKKVIPLVSTGVIMAFIGATLKLKENTFYIILAFSLIIAGLLLWIQPKIKEKEKHSRDSIIKNGFIGAAIGFLSGMVGIGGGIFLSPLLNIFNWDTPKKIAATASLFILVNSIGGIGGQLTKSSESINFNNILFLAISVLIGGQLGSRFGVIKFNQLVVKRMTGILVFLAGLEVLYKHL
ncbi:MAG: sulfite exporter TauE/SafE family protein [Candidatus Dadabacteria bacterium]